MDHKCASKAQIAYILRELHYQISPKFERCTGISQSRLELLQHLYDAEEISQTKLQKVVHIDNAAVTRHLKQLEASGMVNRRKNPEDNRVTLVTLTEQGRSKILSYRKERDQFVTSLLQGFSDEELPVLVDMLHRMQQNAEQIEG
ncbi:MarR family winged helix-turn-helix transcriptional regulator [Fictibacillus fluitans]|uniref:MarR family transcriptional regulator n=1 Tax=Fictibacillus fluitans TaxID=3058422 RepID=A0ABT8HY69_9BACL|nr:MarR family transcriptional regulator [Fictibacillus sp. NE201]MDN4525723.1 MarR family transcriptional regulator [Fictibacillus sp. NE201]